MNRLMERRVMSAALIVLLSGIVWAGVTNYQALHVRNSGAETNTLELEDSSAGDVLTVDAAGDVKLLETGGSSGDADFEVDGYAQFDGTAEFNAAAQFDSTVTMNAAATLTTLTISGAGSSALTVTSGGAYIGGQIEVDGATDLDGTLDVTDVATYTGLPTADLYLSISMGALPGTSPASATFEGPSPTWSFVDSSDDDYGNWSLRLPIDLDPASGITVSLDYLLSATPATEGQWSLNYYAFADGETVSSDSPAVLTAVATPGGSSALDRVTIGTIPAAAIAEADVLALELFHPIGDPFGGTVEVVGLNLNYSRDRP